MIPARVRGKRTVPVLCRFFDDLSLQPPRGILGARRVASYLGMKPHTAVVANHYSRRQGSMTLNSAINSLATGTISRALKTHSHDLKSLDPSCVGHVWPSTQIYQRPTSVDSRTCAI